MNIGSTKPGSGNLRTQTPTVRGLGGLRTVVPRLMLQLLASLQLLITCNCWCVNNRVALRSKVTFSPGLLVTIKSVPEHDGHD